MLRNKLIRILLLSISLICSYGLAEDADSPIQWQPLYEPGCGGWMTGISVSPHDNNRILVSGDMLGIGLSTDGGETWQSTFGFKSWEIAQCTWHLQNPNIVWAGTMSGPYKSSDGGKNWVEMRNGFPPIAGGLYSAPVEIVLFAPDNPQHLLAMGGSSRRWRSPGKPLWGVVWESLDGGENWSRISVIPNGSSSDSNASGKNILGAAYAGGSSQRLYAAVDKQGVYISEDGGHSWEKRNSGLPHLNIERIIVHPTDPDTVWACFGNFKPEKDKEYIPGGIFKSSDAGRSWQSLSNGLVQHKSDNKNLTARYRGFDVSRTNPEVMYTSDMSWNKSGIFRSLNGGRNWSFVANKVNKGFESNFNTEVCNIKAAYPSGLGMTTITIDPTNSDIIYACGSEYIVKSFDGGKTWEDITSINISENIWRGTGYSGLCCQTFEFDPYDPMHSVLLAMDAGNFWQSNDDMQGWVRGGKNLPNWGGGKDVAFTKSGSMIITLGQHGHGGAIAMSSDRGKSWLVMKGEKYGLPKKGIAISVHATEGNPMKVWATWSGGKLYSASSTDWKWHLNTEIEHANRITGDPENHDEFYVTTRKGIYHFDGKDKFEHIGGPEKTGQVVVDGLGRLLAVSHRTKHGGLYRLENGEWTRLLDERYANSVAVDPKNPKRIILTTTDNPYHDVSNANGVWISADDGMTWRQENSGLPMMRVFCVAVNPHMPEQIVIGTNGRGYFTTRWPQTYNPKGDRKFTSFMRKNK